MIKTEALRPAFGITCALLIGVLAVFFSIAGHEYAEWADTVDYHATARFMASAGTFMPAPLDYEVFLHSGASSFGSASINYPNYGFELLIALLGSLRGNFDLLNGVIISATLSVLLSLTVYAMGLQYTGNRVTACLFSLAVLFHHTIIGLVASPLSDLGLAFFLALAVWCALNGKVFLSGFVLGLGYIFREHALMFAPFLPLLAPQVLSLKSYATTAAKFLLTFAPAMLVTVCLGQYFSEGERQANFYAATLPLADVLFSWNFARRFLENLGTYTRYIHAALAIPLLIIAIRYKKFPLSSLKLIIFGVIIAVIPCFLWAKHPAIQPRYLIYSVLLFFLAVLLALQQSPRRTAYFALIVLGCFILRFPTKAINPRSLQALLSPMQTLTEFIATVQEPAQLLGYYPPHPIILSNTSFPYLYLDKAVTVAAPSYATFLSSQGNDKLDGIIVRKRPEDWPHKTILTDNAGNRFELIPFTGKELSKQTRFYKRIPATSGVPQ